MSQPDFRTLPEVVGRPGVRWVGTMVMAEDQYRAEGWHHSGPRSAPSESSYGVAHPVHGTITVHYWRATLEGLRGYGRLVAQRRSDRIAAAITRREADDEFSEHVESILDAKPEYPR
jgi:hypothetical protein